jgi:hypothetical protein
MDWMLTLVRQRVSRHGRWVATTHNILKLFRAAVATSWEAAKVRSAPQSLKNSGPRHQYETESLRFLPV